MVQGAFSTYNVFITGHSVDCRCQHYDPTSRRWPGWHCAVLHVTMLRESRVTLVTHTAAMRRSPGRTWPPAHWCRPPPCPHPSADTTGLITTSSTTFASSSLPPVPLDTGGHCGQHTWSHRNLFHLLFPSHTLQN